MGSETDSSGQSGIQVHFEVFGALAAILLAFLVAGVFQSLGLSALQGSGESIGNLSLAGKALLIVLQYLGFAVVVAAYLQYRHDWGLIRWRVPTLRDLGWVVGGLGVLIVLLIGVSVLFQALGIQTAENQVEVAGNQNPAYYLYLIPITLVLVGPCEELLFRGILQGTLRRAYNPKVAIVLASAVFALFHWWALQASGGGKLTTIAVIFVLGGVLGVVYERSGNIVVTALIHGLFNAAQFLYQYALQTHLL